MSKKEKLNAEVNATIAIIITLLTALFAVIGYLVSGIDKINITQTICAIFGIFLLIVFFAVKSFKRYLKDLENL